MDRSGPVPRPKMTIVVVTRDRPSPLRDCLAAVADQHLDGDPPELIVVDDGSQDAAAVGAAARAVGARILRQPRRGVASARNAGARAATGQIVCFTDDDCRPVPGWTALLAAGLAAGPDVVAGPTVAVPAGGPVVAAWHVIADGFLAALERGEPAGFAPGSNIACRADVLRRVPFDPGYDGVGAEDRDWWARLRAAGVEVGFAPRAVVNHAPELDLRRFLLKQARYGRGAFRYRRAYRRHLPERPSFYGGLVARGFGQGVRVGALVCIALPASAVGYVAEAVTQLRYPLRTSSNGPSFTMAPSRRSRAREQKRSRTPWS